MDFNAILIKWYPLIITFIVIFFIVFFRRDQFIEFLKYLDSKLNRSKYYRVIMTLKVGKQVSKLHKFEKKEPQTFEFRGNKYEVTKFYFVDGLETAYHYEGYILSLVFPDFKENANEYNRILRMRISDLFDFEDYAQLQFWLVIASVIIGCLCLFMLYNQDQKLTSIKTSIDLISQTIIKK